MKLNILKQYFFLKLSFLIFTVSILTPCIWFKVKIVSDIIPETIKENASFICLLGVFLGALSFLLFIIEFIVKAVANKSDKTPQTKAERIVDFLIFISIVIICTVFSKLAYAFIFFD